MYIFRFCFLISSIFLIMVAHSKEETLKEISLHTLSLSVLNLACAKPPCHTDISYRYNISSYIPHYKKFKQPRINLVVGISFIHKSLLQTLNSNNKNQGFTSAATTSYPYVGLSVDWYLESFHLLKPDIYLGIHLSEHSFSNLLSGGYIGGRFSLDILDSDFSFKIKSEYGIKDIGFFVEFIPFDENPTFLAGIFVNL